MSKNRETFERARLQVGHPIEVLHRYCTFSGWKEETLRGTLTQVNMCADGAPYGRLQIQGGGGFDCYVDAQGMWRHGR